MKTKICEQCGEQFNEVIAPHRRGGLPMTTSRYESGINTGGTPLPPATFQLIIDIISRYHLPRYVVADSDRRKCAREIMKALEGERGQ